MTHTIFIVTYHGDFRYLVYCLKSIAKFATGFDTVLQVPGTDFDEAVRIVRGTHPACAVRCGDEWPEKGMLYHMSVIMHSDEWCPKSDVIYHLDADCIFTEPVSPADYTEDGKPVLIYESFNSMRRKGITETDKWQVCTQKCLPFDVNYETMRRHPEVYRRELYPKARALVEEKVGMPIDEYIKSGPNAFPQLFCEHNTLGNVALQCFAKDYSLFNLEHREWPPNKVRQAWSHREPTQEDMDAFKKAGLV